MSKFIMEQTTNAFTEINFECKVDTGAHGRKYEKDLAFLMFVWCSLAQCRFKIFQEMNDGGKFDDVALFFEHEAWLFQAKHSKTPRQVACKELFPDDKFEIENVPKGKEHEKKCFEGKDFDLYKYIRSYSCVENNPKIKSFEKTYFLFTNNTLLEDNDLKEWGEIVPKKFTNSLSTLMDFSKLDAYCKGFKPKEEKIDKIRDTVNNDFLTLKDAIITLFEEGKVKKILTDHRTPLSNVLEKNGTRVKFHQQFLAREGDEIEKMLHQELQTHYQQKSQDMESIGRELNKDIKELLRGKSKNVHLPPFITNTIVKEFFDRFTFCIDQPSDLSATVDYYARKWMMDWIRPDVLVNLDKPQLMLPRFKFYEVFQKWMHGEKSNDKFYISYEIGKECITGIEDTLKPQFPKPSEAIDRYYVNRFLKVHEPKLDNQTSISEDDFVKLLEENFDQKKCTILIAEPGMGKTTLLQHIGFEVQKRFKRDVFLIHLKKIDKKLKIKENLDVKGIVSDMLKDVLSSIGLDALKNNLEKGGNSSLVLFDGFDEIAPSQVGNIFTLLKMFQKIQKLQVIISGRKHVQESLEQNLSLNNSKPVVMNLIPFMDADQRKFLKSFWNIPSDQEADDDWERINKKFDLFSTLLLHKFHSDIRRRQYNFTGLPLMIRMLAEIHTDSFNSFLGSKSDDTREIFTAGEFSVLKLFEEFVKISFNMKTKKKQGLDAYSIVEPFDKDDDEMEPQFDQFVLEHQLIAIRQLAVEELNHVIVDGKYSENNARLLKRIKTGNEKSLLINFTSEENPVEFVHLSYAEYFVAKYLFDNADCYKESLFQILEKYQVVRRFFFLQIEETFDSNLKQLTIVDNICNTQPDVAFWACKGSCVKVVKKLLENRDFQTKQYRYDGTLLHVAVQVDCSALVEYLLYEHGIEVDANNEFKKTPLHVASEEGHLEIAKILIDASAKLEATNLREKTPLHLAVENNHLELVLMLIDQLPIVKAHDKRHQLSTDLAGGKIDVFNALIARFTIEGVEEAVGRSLLHVAINNDHFEYAKIMIGRLEKINDLDTNGMTPLHYAAQKDLFDIAKLLIDQSTNTVVKNEDETSPLHLAVENGCLEIAKLLVDHSANIGAQDKFQQTPLHLAAVRGHLKISKMLLENSAKVDVRNYSDSTPLHEAVEYNQFEIAKLLLEHSSNVDLQCKDGSTPLHLAAKEGHLEISKMLIAQSADVEVQNQYEETPLHLAAEEGHLEIAKMLIAQSADVEVQNIFEQTPLHLAANRGHWELLVMLIDQLPNVAAHRKKLQLSITSAAGNKNMFELLIERFTIEGVPDKVGRPLLHLAIESDESEFATTLIEQSVNINDRDNYNKTPIHVAVEKGNLKITKLLIDQSANIDAQDNDGQTPLHIAAKKEHLEIAKMLLKNSANVDVQNNAGKTSLHNALSWRNKNDGIVKLLIDNSADVNAKENDGQTPLHFAAEKNRLEVAKMLIDHSADVNAQDNDGQTPLHIAAEEEHLEIAKMLLKNSANVDVQNNAGETPLHNASSWRNKNDEIVKLLIDHSADVNIQENEGHTPLHFAAKWNRLEVAKMLIHHSADVNAQDNDGQTPLHIAAEEEHLEIAKMLLKNSANVDVQNNAGKTSLHNALSWRNKNDGIVKLLIDNSADVNAKENDGQTPLHFAAEKNRLEVAKMLIDHSADVNAQDNDGQTPLHIAAEEEHLEIAKMLLKNSANVDVQNNAGKTSLHNALSWRNKNDGIVKLLIDNSADVNAKENDGQTPLHFAAEKNRLEVAKMLIDHSADVNAQDNDGQTPLHIAAEEEHLEIAKMLLKNSANVDVQNNAGETPLHNASSWRNKNDEIVKLLIDHSADVNIQENEGHTPLHFAAKWNRLEVAKMLIHHSADVNAQENRGRTPLHFAAMHNRLEIVKMLLDRSASVDVLDNQHQTPLQLAAKCGHLEVVKTLEQFVRP